MAVVQKVGDRKSGYHGFRIDGKMVRGLLPTLKRCFYPDYDQKNCKYGPLAPLVKGKRLPPRSHKGKILGSLVDEQVVKVVVFCTKFNIHPIFLAGDKPPSREIFENAYRHRVAVDLHKQMNDYTKRLFRTLDAWKLTPIEAQIPVGNASFRIGTAVDLLCRHEKGHKVVIEVKTGFDRYYRRFSGMLKPPFQKQDNSPRNQHQLQLAFSAQLYSSQVKEAVSAYVVRIHRTGESVYPLDKWAKEKIADAFKAIAS